MPNHCHNRVTFYAQYDGEKACAQIAKLKKIFEDENCFTQIIPEPDWPNTPLMTGQESYLGRIRGNLGELPVKREDPWTRYEFMSTGQTDDRWYDWRVQNWDTKWDAYDVVITDDDEEQLEVEFNTAWSPPEAICNQIREDYPDVSVSWFYDEPGMELAGYL